jgi:hypothetical protein
MESQPDLERSDPAMRATSPGRQTTPMSRWVDLPTDLPPQLAPLRVLRRPYRLCIVADDSVFERSVDGFHPVVVANDRGADMRNRKPPSNNCCGRQVWRCILY